MDNIVGYKGMAYRLLKYDHAQPIFCVTCNEQLTCNEASQDNVCGECSKTIEGVLNCSPCPLTNYHEIPNCEPRCDNCPAVTILP